MEPSEPLTSILATLSDFKKYFCNKLVSNVDDASIACEKFGQKQIKPKIVQINNLHLISFLLFIFPILFL